MHSSKFFMVGIILFHLFGTGNFLCFGQTGANPQKGRLFVDTDPQSSKVRILNIKPKFYQGMKLGPGKYLVEVSNPGYVSIKKWVKLVAGKKEKLSVRLQRTKKNTDKSSLAENDMINDFKAAIRIDPENPETHLLLGVAYYNLKRYEDAISPLKEAIRIDPDNPETYFWLGNAYNRLKRYEDAINTLKEAIRIDPDNPETHFLLGLIYIRKGKTELVFKEYKTLKRLDPERAEELFNLI